MQKKVKDRLGRFHNVGIILREEVFGGFEQYVIDFGEEGIQRLRSCDVEVTKPLTEKLYEGNYDIKSFILRTKASVLFNDDLSTGSLSRMKLDIIPHQMIMADKATKSKAKGFLIADDVGLGKTIEAGLVIRSMIAHGRADRILLLCPANLTMQWREQLSERFDEWFDILSTEIKILDPRRWNHNPRIIASIQTLRMPKHRDILLDSTQEWDLVIVDEAHHLTAKEYGSKVNRTKNYKLLEELRDRTRFFLFLTATPHQGDDNMFAMLLKLVDPDYVTSVKDLGDNINDIIGRNLKSEVTDFDGNKLFRGHNMVRHEMTPSERYSFFMSELERFVRDGLMSLDMKGSRLGAENFVLTSFLKLSASSPEAIKRTLINRHSNLKKGFSNNNIPSEYDYRYEGEYEEQRSSKVKEIFEGEIKRIESLLTNLEGIVDPKLDELSNIIKSEGLLENKTERLLIFTEYRGTQDMIKDYLEKIFGDGSVLLMNGDLSTDKKRQVIKNFEMKKRLLVSTEAGGEGIDLHKNCHIMVNYDIPWNPMRLHQRTGRLDRYGQKNKVHVHYLVVKDTIDDKIQRFLEEKINRIANRLGDLKGDNAENLYEDILGQINLSRDSLSRIYLSEDKASEQQLEDNIDEAVEVYKRHEDVFKGIRGFNLNEFRRISSAHTLDDLEKLIRQYLVSRKRRLIKEENDIVHFEVPDEIKEMKIFHGRRLVKSNIRGTFDRTKADELGVDILGTGNEYIDAMIDRMIKGTDSGNVLATKIHVAKMDDLCGKKGLLASYIVTSTPIVGGKQSFDGVEFVFCDHENDRLYDDENVNPILEIICDEKNYSIIEPHEIPENDQISIMIEEIECLLRNRIGEGGIGSIQLNSIAWLEFLRDVPC